MRYLNESESPVCRMDLSKCEMIAVPPDSNTRYGDLSDPWEAKYLYGCLGEECDGNEYN